MPFIVRFLEAIRSPGVASRQVIDGPDGFGYMMAPQIASVKTQMALLKLMPEHEWREMEANALADHYDC